MLLLVMSLVACQSDVTQNPLAPKPVAQAPASPAAGAAQPQADEPPPQHYSPFVINLHNSEVFHKISFKDVGARTTEAERAALYEALAESLRFELKTHQHLKLQGEVTYDEAITDPRNHLACGAYHLYVDFWRSSQPDRWGYSLWSGCGDDDNFAWQEVAYAPSAAQPLTSQVQPLAKHIAQTLGDATSRSCYQKVC